MARTIARDHDDKRRAILKRAAAVFAREGFDRASVARVAAACDISKANIYHYYSSKDDLLFDILDTYLSGLRDRICGLDLAGLEPEAAFHRCVVEVLLAYRGADDEHRLQANGLARLPPERQAVLRGYQRELVDHMAARVAALAPEVFDGDRARLRAATMSVFGMLNWFYMWNGKASEAERRDYAGVVCGLCLRGVGGLGVDSIESTLNPLATLD